MSIDMKIEVSELSKIYGKFTAVDHISFNIDGSLRKAAANTTLALWPLERVPTFLDGSGISTLLPKFSI